MSDASTFSPEQALAKFSKMIRRLAKMYESREFPAEDLEQEAKIQTIEAIKTWKPDGGRTLANYVRFQIRYRLKALVRKSVLDTVSLDEEFSCDDGEFFTRHDVIGEPPLQEIYLQSARFLENVEKRLSATEQEILALRSEGLSFSEIGSRLGKDTHAAMMAWRRAQEKL